MAECGSFLFKCVNASSVGSYPEQCIFVLIDADNSSLANSLRIDQRIVLIGLDEYFLDTEHSSTDAPGPNIIHLIFVQAVNGVVRQRLLVTGDML